MWSVWGVLVLLLAALYLFRSSIERDEEDQLFLDESFDNRKNAQAVIVERANKMRPLLWAAKGLVAASTLFVVVYYLIDFAHQFQ
jgi:hypothetical protein